MRNAFSARRYSKPHFLLAIPITAFSANPRRPNSAMATKVLP
jgi:hypothetical protein